jgi:hypothetical protein
MGYESYMFPSYIKSSVIGTVSLVLVFAALFDKGVRKIYCYIFPAVGLLINGLLSPTGFCLGMIAVASILLIPAIYEKKVNSLLKIGIVIISSIVIVIGLKAADRAKFFNSGFEDTLTKTYIDDIEKLTVFGYPDYWEFLEDEYGISGDEYENLKEYNVFYVLNRTKESMSFMHTLASEKKNFNGANLLSFFRTVPIRFIKIGYTFLYVIIGFVFMMSNDKKKNIVVTITTSYIFIVYCIAFFFYAWHNKITDMIAFLPAVYVLLINLPVVDELKNKELVLYLSLMGVILYNNFSDKIVTEIDTKDLNKYIEDVVADESVTAVINFNDLYRNRSPYSTFIPHLLDKDNLVISNGYYTVFAEYNDYQFVVHKNEELLLNGHEEISFTSFVMCE